MSKKTSSLEFLPIEDVPFVSDIINRIQHSLPDYSEITSSGLTVNQFLKLKEKIEKYIAKQIKYNLVDKKFAHDKNLGKLHKALLNYHPADARLKAEIKSLKEVWDVLNLDTGYALVKQVIDANPDYLSAAQKNAVESLYASLEAKFPQLFKEPDRYREIITYVDRTYSYFEVMDDLGKKREEPRKKLTGTIGHIYASTFDEYEKEKEVLEKAVDASGLAELEEIGRLLSAHGWGEFVEEKFGRGTTSKLRYILSKKDKIKLTEGAASRIRQIRGALAIQEAASKEMLNPDEFTQSAYRELESNPSLRFDCELVSKNPNTSEDDIRMICSNWEGDVSLPPNLPVYYIHGTDDSGNYIEKFGKASSSKDEIDRVLTWLLEVNSKEDNKTGRKPAVRLKIIPRSL